MPEGAEVFSNPLAPPSASNAHHGASSSAAHIANLTNADFRKLLMTPRSAPSAAPPSVKPPSVKETVGKPRQYNEDDDPTTARRKKKKYYAKLHKQEEERERELASKYRDRARERREGVNPDYQSTDTLSSTANYRAVGPTQEANDTTAERRRLAIQESKFLGGDMEHTHLVKGLDFALLQKVRSEITGEGDEGEGEHKPHKQKADRVEEEGEEDLPEFKTRQGQRIYKTIFRSKVPEKNELFQTGRMAYVFELEDEYAESDIPTTLLRSKADCPGVETQTTLTTNDIVINKLTQILSYLRQGMRNKKMKKKEKAKEKEKELTKPKSQGPEDSIFGDVGDYDTGIALKEHKKEKQRGRDRDQDRDHRDQDRDHRGRHRDRDREERRHKENAYFEKPSRDDQEELFNKSDMSAAEFAKSVTQKFKKTGAEWEKSEANQLANKAKAKQKKEQRDVNFVPDSYAECYPGAMEVADTTYDSDDDADYTKMDLGNKKGPIKRWDFEDEEQYNSYMETREALPKAAFQFGIKMSEGRKTRRTGPKDEKTKLDRDWQRISRMLATKSKSEEDGESGGKRAKHF
ncbi:protein Red [Nematostella vectensis]|uniref:protein Red n=1 Tax=Nematostella vectensis TaxID=45351 RepID=UPI002076F213|nr:protein Red [Nematostella vectensis]